MISSVDFMIIIIVAIVSLNGIACSAAPDIDIPFKNNKNPIFPNEIVAVVGGNIYFEIMQPLADQTDCLYHRTGGHDVSIQPPNIPNYDPGRSEKCGFIIEKIMKADQGFRRLTSTRQNKVFKRGTVRVRVREAIQIPKDKNPIELSDKPSYCYVVRPEDTDSSRFPQHETCDFPKYQNDIKAAGKWNIILGFKGKTHEVSFDVNLEPMVEKIQTFTETDAKTGSLNLKCKLLNTNKTTSWCRFLRLSDNIGYNLEDGFGDEKYRYIGQGLANNECGISILNPDTNDKSMWKCFMGVEEGEHVEPGGIRKADKKTLKTVGAIVGGVESHKNEGEIEADNVYGLKDTPVNLICKSKSTVDYCWFKDPGGNKISVSDRKPIESNDVLRYYGTGLKLGDCGLTIMKATHNDSGTWSCHMGSANVTVIDRVKEINVRIADTSLVSTSLFRDGQIGASLIIDCKSIPAHVPLDYCRFVLPDGTGFSLDEKTTVHKPFMNQYYFNPNRQMRSGYCSVIIKNVERSHVGQWTCAARLVGRDSESSDEFRVNILDADGVSAAAISGFAFGISFGLGVMAVFLYTAYRKFPKRSTKRTTAATAVSYISSSDRMSIQSDNNSNAENVESIELAEVQNERL